MDSKEFKQMIKQHKVKQTFCIPEDDYILRVYIDTEDPEVMYKCRWSIDYISLSIKKTVDKITRAEYIDLYNKYKAYALKLLNDDVYHACMLNQTVSLLNECQMYQKKYYKVLLDTLSFIVNDRRITND